MQQVSKEDLNQSPNLTSFSFCDSFYMIGTDTIYIDKLKRSCPMEVSQFKQRMVICNTHPQKAFISKGHLDAFGEEVSEPDCIDTEQI